MSFIQHVSAVCDVYSVYLDTQMEIDVKIVFFFYFFFFVILQDVSKIEMK